VESNQLSEAEVKLAAIREWVNREHDNMSYVQIVHGIRSVLDWSAGAQNVDSEILETIRETKKMK